MPNQNFKIVFVNGYSINFGRKESLFTKKTIEKNGKVLFNSRWRKIHSNEIGSKRWIVVEGLKFPIV